MKIMKLILFISGLAVVNSFIAATRAVKSPGKKDFSFLKKKATAKSSSLEEWRWFGRDRDSKTPPLFLTTLYRGDKSIGSYKELTTYAKQDAVKRNPYKNNAPI
jgi:hypothetical protein